MRHKSWTFTTYKDGKPVATREHLSHEEAIVALRAAVAGEEAGHVGHKRRPERLSPAELGAAAALARAA